MSTPNDDVAAATGIDEPLDVTEVADANDLRDTTTVAGGTGGRTDPPLEADPADVAEQDAAVPHDESGR